MQKLRVIQREDLIYPELSYEIIGSSFDVYNEIGAGHSEKVYEKALAESFSAREIIFKEQLYAPIKYRDKIIGKRFLDFLIDGKIVVEIKKGSQFSKSNIDQVLEYIKMNNIKLAILINFGNQGVLFKRIINFPE